MTLTIETNAIKTEKRCSTDMGTCENKTVTPSQNFKRDSGKNYCCALLLRFIVSLSTHLLFIHFLTPDMAGIGVGVLNPLPLQQLVLTAIHKYYEEDMDFPCPENTIQTITESINPAPCLTQYLESFPPLAEVFETMCESERNHPGTVRFKSGRKWDSSDSFFFVVPANQDNTLRAPPYFSPAALRWCQLQKRLYLAPQRELCLGQPNPELDDDLFINDGALDDAMRTPGYKFVPLSCVGRLIKERPYYLHYIQAQHLERTL